MNTEAKNKNPIYITLIASFLGAIFLSLIIFKPNNHILLPPGLLLKERKN
jgi:hypothetical protein